VAAGKANHHFQEIHAENKNDGQAQEGLAVVCVWKNFRNA